VSGHHGGSDGWIVKMDTIGNIQWQKALGGILTDWFESIQQTTDGGYIAAGTSTSNDGDVPGNNGATDYWIVKLNSAGDTLWTKTYGGSGEDRSYDMIQTADGGYILAGVTNSNDGDVSGNNGMLDYWIVKLDTMGDIQWQKTLGGTSNDYAYSIRQAIDGEYIVVGILEYSDGDKDFWLVKLNSLGDTVWTKTLGGTSWDVPKSIQQTTDGGYIVAGGTDSNDGDVTGNNGGNDYWIVKLSAPTAIKEFLQTENFSVYPNPFTTSTKIQSTHPISSYRIYSISGRLVRQEENGSGNTITIDRGSLPSGMYFVEVLSEDGILGRQKVIIQ